MTNPPVSVVITNFNYGTYIADTVQSIAEQTHKVLELIIVDDGSTDNSVEVIERLKILHNDRFQRISAHYLSKNRGINGALNVAVQDIRGEITLIVDADDLLDPEHLSTLVTALLKHHEFDFAVTFSYCDCILIDEGRKRIQRGLSKPFDGNLIKQESFLPRPSPILSPALKSAFPLPEDSKEDPKHLLWKKICRVGNKGVYVPEPLFFYRIHNKNVSKIGQKVRAAQEMGLADNPIYLSDYWPHC